LAYTAFPDPLGLERVEEITGRREDGKGGREI